MIFVEPSKMSRARKTIAVASLLLAAGCSTPSAAPEIPGLKVTLLGDPQDRGTPDQPLDFSLDVVEFRINIEALREGGQVDPSFNGRVVVEVRPSGKLDRGDPLTVDLVQGVAKDVAVRFKQAYGEVRLIALQRGHDPVGPSKLSEAQCNNGKDDDHDGYIDFPSDRGCFHAADNTEGGGAGAAGASAPIYFANPTIYDVQKPHGLGKGADLSALVQDRITIDRGFMIVTRVGTDGMYITDFDGVRWDQTQARFVVDPVDLSYRSLFAFNFSTPLNLQEGDCLVSLSGTVEEFYGYTELGKPTWKKGDLAYCGAKLYNASGGKLADCAPSDDEERQRRCRVELEELANTPFDVTRMVVSDEGQERSVWDQRYMQTERFESALVQVSDVEISQVAVFTEVRECDRNDNGIIDYYDKEEADCSNDCGDTEGCVVAETYRRFGQWTVTFVDGLGVIRELSVVTAGSIPKFDPLKAQGQRLSRIVGTLRHLVFGRPPWILEPRRPADCPDCKTD